MNGIVLFILGFIGGVAVTWLLTRDRSRQDLTQAPDFGPSRRPAPRPSAPPQTRVTPGTPLSPDTRREIVALLRANQKINAIKAYKDATGSGLKDSKDAVEAIERTVQN